MQAMQPYNSTNFMSMITEESGPENHMESLYKLKEILFIYASEKDDLSRLLKGWALRWLDLLPEDYNDEDVENDPVADFSKQEKEIFEKANDLLEELRLIFENPLNIYHPPIQDPLFDGKQMWEKKDYLRFRQLSTTGLSPFIPNQYLEAFPHPFAKAMGRWAKSLPKVPKQNIVSMNQVSAFSLVPLNQSSFQSIQNRNIKQKNSFVNENPTFELIAYQALAAQAIDQKALQKIKNELTLRSAKEEKRLMELKALLKEEAEKAKQYAMLVQQVFNDRLAELEKDYKKAIEIVDATMKHLKSDLENERNSSNQKEERLQANSAELARQIEEKARLQQEHLQKQVALRHAFELQLNRDKTQYLLQLEKKEEELNKTTEKNLKLEQEIGQISNENSLLQRQHESKMRENNFEKELQKQQFENQIQQKTLSLVNQKKQYEEKIASELAEKAQMQQEHRAKLDETQNQLQQQYQKIVSEEMARIQNACQEKMLSMQQQHENRLNERLRSIEQKNQAAINAIIQEKNVLEGRVNALKGEVHQEKSVNGQHLAAQKNFQKILESQAIKIRKLHKKSKRKFGIF